MDFPGIHSLLSRATGRSSCPSLSSIFPAPPVVGHGRSGPRPSEICPPPRAILSRTGWTMHGNMCVTSQKGKFLDSYIVTLTRAPGSISLGACDTVTDTIHACRTRALFPYLPTQAMLPQP